MKTREERDKEDKRERTRSMIKNNLNVIRTRVNREEDIKSLEKMLSDVREISGLNIEQIVPIPVN